MFSASRAIGAAIQAAVFLLFAFGITPSTAWGVLDIEFVLDDPAPIVGPYDDVAVNATIFNLPHSDEILFGSDFGFAGAAPGTLAASSHFINSGPYHLSFGGTNSIDDQFRGVRLGPGESVSFTYATLAPVQAPIAPGTYRSQSLSIIFYKSRGTPAVRTFWESAPLEVTVVPEPSSLFALATCCMFGLTLRHQR